MKCCGKEMYDNGNNFRCGICERRYVKIHKSLRCPVCNQRMYDNGNNLHCGKCDYRKYTREYVLVEE